MADVDSAAAALQLPAHLHSRSPLNETSPAGSTDDGGVCSSSISSSWLYLFLCFQSRPPPSPLCCSRTEEVGGMWGGAVERGELHRIRFSSGGCIIGQGKRGQYCMHAAGWECVANICAPPILVHKNTTPPYVRSPSLLAGNSSHKQTS